jgi:hypothetical protein
MDRPPTRWVAQAFTQAGRPLSHRTIARWHWAGWKPVTHSVFEEDCVLTLIVLAPENPHHLPVSVHNHMPGRRETVLV